MIWLTVHIIRTGRDRLWLVAGAVAGVGLLNKDLPEVLLAAIALALAVVPETRRHLSSKWLWLGGLVAALIWAPTLWWQATNGWPQATLAHEIHDEYSQSRQPHRLLRRAAPAVRTGGHVALGVGCHQAVA